MKYLITFLSFFLLSLSLVSQEKWIIDSSYLSSSDTVLVYKPDNYDHKSQYPLVYLLHGYSMDYNQWSQTIDCQDFANRYNTIIVCPEGFTYFYLNSLSDNKRRYEDFFFLNLVPRVHKELSIDNKNIFISGLSMGGYGALRFFILYPDYFNTAGSTSGAVTINYQQSRDLSFNFWGNNRLNDDLGEILGANIYDWDKHSIVNLLKENKDFNRPFIFDCGTEDVLYPENIKLKEITDSLNIPVTFIAQPGNHNTEYWEHSIEYHFIFFKQHRK